MSDLTQLAEFKNASIPDQAELMRFQKMLAIVGSEMELGASRAAATAKACLEVYGDIYGHVDRHVTGEEGVRDSQHPCADFYYGQPHHLNRCEGDGHYLCNECKNHKIEEPEDDEDAPAHPTELERIVEEVRDGS